MKIGFLCILTLLLAGCDVTADLPGVPVPSSNSTTMPSSSTEGQASDRNGMALDVAFTQLNPRPAVCEDRFVAHDLDHITLTDNETVHLFESNGSGLAVNDLDGDADLDIVLGNLAGPNSILWNEGGLTFGKQELGPGQTRSVNIVDVDGDGLQDIVLARRMQKPRIWRNQGGSQPPVFVQLEGLGVWEKAYTQAWADMDGDKDLDWVIASYDAELAKDDPNQLGHGGGVSIYQNQPDAWVGTNLAVTAQALALLLTDLNQDGLTDILVGNDFYLQDFVWLQQADGNWQEATPFAVMPMNTMSFAAADLENDGDQEVFVGDMKPYRSDEETLAAWAPVMEHMEPVEGDPQVMENVLNVRGNDGMFENQSGLRGVDATGWSWSAQFGDLDNDGFLDFYIVNGMQAEELFDHLPNDELVEENLAYRNDGTGNFVESAQWNLNSKRGGRGMAMADLDNDGDLDIVVNNLRTPSQLFENRLCGGDGLALDLFWPGSGNSRAIGATVALHTSTGTYYREVRSAGGYLSGEPARLHFGVPTGSRLARLEIRWPDGEVMTLSDNDLKINTLLTISRR